MTTQTETATLTPVKGLKWLHARRTEYDGRPQEMTVTSVNVSKGIVYSRNPQHTKIRTPLALFALGKMVLSVVSVPEPPVNVASPKLSDDQAQALYAKAQAAGMAAGEAVIPTPMHVVERANPFDDNSAVVRRYAPVMDGPCGFAAITIRPGNSSFARWLKANKRAYSGYYGGTELSVSQFGQSLTRKTVYARAFTEVLRAAGIDASYNSRMD